MQPEDADSLNEKGGITPLTNLRKDAIVVHPESVVPDQPVGPSLGAPNDADPLQPATSSSQSFVTNDEVIQRQMGTEERPNQPIDRIGEATAPPPARRSGRKKVLIVAAILVPLLLIGASAGAYFGYVVPNQPENLLKDALLNATTQKQVTIDATLDLEAADSAKVGALAATTVEMKGQADAVQQRAQVAATVTVSGVKIPVEARYIDQTAYLKFGDLGTAKALIGAYEPFYGSLIDDLSNQWIEIDKTLLKQVGASCLIGTPLVLTQDDAKLLARAYQAYSFITIKSTSHDTVSGKSAVKFDLLIDDNKLADYVKNLDSLSFLKKIKDCGGAKQQIDTTTLADGDTTPISLWIDKADRTIVKLAVSTTPADVKKSNIKATLSAAIGYGKVSIEKPTDAKSLMTILGEGSEGLPSIGASQNISQDVERQVDITAIHSQLEAYYASNGIYPTLANLNDSKWVQTNFKGLDREALKDPEGTSYIIVAVPQASTYAYAVTGGSGQVCANNNPNSFCEKYTLTATFENGTKYTKISLN